MSASKKQKTVHAPTVDVTLLVKTFRKIASTLAADRYCEIEMNVPSQPDEVKWLKTKSLHGGRLRFSGPAHMKIAVRPHGESKAPKETYVPLGIAFRKTEGTDADSLGLEIFGHPEIDEKNCTIQVFNTWQDIRDVTYEFFVFIQRKSDGALGLIDPDIENREEP